MGSRRGRRARKRRLKLRLALRQSAEHQAVLRELGHAKTRVQDLSWFAGRLHNRMLFAFEVWPAVNRGGIRQGRVACEVIITDGESLHPIAGPLAVDFAALEDGFPPAERFCMRAMGELFGECAREAWPEIERRAAQ